MESKFFIEDILFSERNLLNYYSIVLSYVTDEELYYELKKEFENLLHIIRELISILIIKGWQISDKIPLAKLKQDILQLKMDVNAYK